VIFQAKVNSLDAVRRERVSMDDQNGPQTDYLDPTHLSVTNEMAVLTPYEVVFQSFSAELAGVLAGFASGEHGIIVKSVNVEPASATSGLLDPNAPGGAGMYPPNYYEGNLVRPPVGGMPPTVPAQPTARGGLQTVLDEKPVKVTLVLNVVRLLPRN
jgi:hypothetical protein